MERSELSRQSNLCHTDHGYSHEQYHEVHPEARATCTLSLWLEGRHRCFCRLWGWWTWVLSAECWRVLSSERGRLFCRGIEYWMGLANGIALSTRSVVECMRLSIVVYVYCMVVGCWWWVVRWSDGNTTFLNFKIDDDLCLMGGRKNWMEELECLNENTLSRSTVTSTLRPSWTTRSNRSSLL